MKSMLLRMRRSLTRGLAGLLEKQGSDHPIYASVSQKRLLINRVSSQSLNHVNSLNSLGLEPSDERSERLSPPFATT